MHVDRGGPDEQGGHEDEGADSDHCRVGAVLGAQKMPVIAQLYNGFLCGRRISQKASANQ